MQYGADVIDGGMIHDVCELQKVVWETAEEKVRGLTYILNDSVALQPTRMWADTMA